MPRLVVFIYYIYMEKYMEKLSFFWQKIVEIYQQVFSVLRKNPTVVILFIWLAILDVIALVLLFLAPSPPVSGVLAPIIRTFWGDYFLHYPNNFLILPKLFGHAHFIITTVVGVFVSGLVIKKIEADTKGEKLSTLSAAAPVFKRYFSLILVWLLSYGVFVVVFKGILPLLPHNLWVQFGGGFFLGLFIQSILAFLLPALLIIENGFFKALWEGIRFGFKNVVLMSGLIFIPMLFALVISFVKLYTPLFVRIRPEIVVWVLAVGIVISLVVDIFVTSSATLLFLKVRNKS